MRDRDRVAGSQKPHGKLAGEGRGPVPTTGAPVGDPHDACARTGRERADRRRGRRNQIRDAGRAQHRAPHGLVVSRHVPQLRRHVRVTEVLPQVHRQVRLRRSLVQVAERNDLNNSHSRAPCRREGRFRLPSAPHVPPAPIRGERYVRGRQPARRSPAAKG
ncbi:hypothetical protein SLNWT_3802 [Streptomyces albus]|uniref:Uncharacterized protein n=1 Tax=Streptomyces albus (strain ATCC 21838 / DSM 41398 / FERM P-419 / JCM 4703 / NBRC 107858) TaxID=1081613 RepID=A0A0B5ENG2_STRA4|nr:hypothetical protein SLNWT_3802 [Streptomyces albus]